MISIAQVFRRRRHGDEMASGGPECTRMITVVVLVMIVIVVILMMIIMTMIMIIVVVVVVVVIMITARPHSRRLGTRGDRGRQLSLGLGPRASGQRVRAKYYTSKITKVNFRWKRPLKVHLKSPLKIHDDF